MLSQGYFSQHIEYTRHHCAYFISEKGENSFNFL